MLRFLALLLFFPSLAFGEWTTADTVRQGVFTSLVYVDWRQTSFGQEHGYTELNHILGMHPSQGKLNTYFTTVAVGHAAISYMLPRGWREGWQYVWIGIEIKTVAHNRSIGIKVPF